jgi:ethanolamine utilization protein EutQ (cupin superfamily)
MYINDVLGLAWKASESSFAAKDSVLTFERLLNGTFDSDKKYTLEQKGQTQVKVYSKEYSKAYNQLLGNQVENRMRMSIIAIGSVWYTCWVDAGQPDLTGIKTTNIMDEERKKTISAEQQLMQERKMIGREE